MTRRSHRRALLPWALAALVRCISVSAESTAVPYAPLDKLGQEQIRYISWLTDRFNEELSTKIDDLEQFRGKALKESQERAATPIDELVGDSTLVWKDSADRQAFVRRFLGDIYAVESEIFRTTGALNESLDVIDHDIGLVGEPTDCDSTIEPHRNALDQRLDVQRNAAYLRLIRAYATSPDFWCKTDEELQERRTVHLRMIRDSVATDFQRTVCCTAGIENSIRCLATGFHSAAKRARVTISRARSKNVDRAAQNNGLSPADFKNLSECLNLMDEAFSSLSNVTVQCPEQPAKQDSLAR